MVRNQWQFTGWLFKHSSRIMGGSSAYFGGGQSRKCLVNAKELQQNVNPTYPLCRWIGSWLVAYSNHQLIIDRIWKFNFWGAFLDYQGWGIIHGLQMTNNRVESDLISLAQNRSFLTSLTGDLLDPAGLRVNHWNTPMEVGHLTVVNWWTQIVQSLCAAPLPISKS